MRPYQYRCNDYSLLTPAFKKYMVSPLIRFVPWAVPANIVTFISNLFVYICLYLALNPELLGRYTRISVALGLLIYLIGDHLDGMQAKRTGTGSALGEFCDHYLDAFNNGIILFTMFAIFGVSNPYIIGGVMAASYLAHMSIFYEQFKTGWLTFEKLGSLEGVLFSALLIGISGIDTVSGLLIYQPVAGLTTFEIIMLISGVGALITFITTIKRTPEVKAGFWIFTLMFVGVTILSIQLFSNLQLFTLLTLYSSLYIGRIMQGHLVDGIERHSDWPTFAYLLLLLIFDLPANDYSFYALTGYLTICIGLLVYHVFSPLKIYWVWINART